MIYNWESIESQCQIIAAEGAFAMEPSWLGVARSCSLVDRKGWYLTAFMGAIGTGGFVADFVDLSGG